MIITSLTEAYRLAQLEDGRHRAAHDYRMALYTSDAELGPQTECYSPAGEAKGQGYQAGGLLLQGRRAMVVDGIAMLGWLTPQWNPATIAADGCLIYNASLRDRDAIVTYAFGRRIVSTNGPFTPHMPLGFIQWAEARAHG